MTRTLTTADLDTLEAAVRIGRRKGYLLDSWSDIDERILAIIAQARQVATIRDETWNAAINACIQWHYDRVGKFDERGHVRAVNGLRELLKSQPDRPDAEVAG